MRGSDVANIAKSRQVVLGLLALLIGAPAWADWKYSQDIDQMTGQTRYLASATSVNSLSLQFPYAGQNTADLVVRQHPKSGTNVYLILDKGQILCSTYEQCSIGIKFDNAPPQRFRASPSSDRSSNIVFINSESGFLAKAKSAKSILVGIEVYQNGLQVLQFPALTPLVWPPKSNPLSPKK